MGLSKAHRQLIKETEAKGGRVFKKKKGFVIRGPKGTAMIHMTTSDHRALANARADIKRAGVDL